MGGSANGHIHLVKGLLSEGLICEILLSKICFDFNQIAKMFLNNQLVRVTFFVLEIILEI